MRLVSSLILTLLIKFCLGQDTTVSYENTVVTLPEVIVRNNLDYLHILKQIKEDTTFYKAFRNLRVIEYTSLNNIRMLNNNENVEASYNSKTRQHRENGCRTTEVLDQQTTGNFFDKNGEYNYITGEMYAGLFFSKGKVCGETNIVAGTTFNTGNKSGMEKHKEQLKMLFFNPGRKIPGIPFIGNKLDLYDENAHKLYDYRLDYIDYKGSYAYVFSIKAKDNLGIFRRGEIVVDEMTTWFDAKTMDVLARNYSLSYKAGVYDFDVQMNVEMTKFEDLLVPKFLRYKGNFKVIFKKRERGEFTATLFNYNK